MAASKNKSLKQTAYDYIKHKILSCEYEPGMYLNEKQLCNEMGNISRTPVRDALGRLEQEGLLTIHSKKGIMITNIHLSDINRIYEVRLLLEPYTLQRYGNRLGPEKLKRFAEILSDPGRAKSDYSYYFYDLDDQFHSFIMGALQNQFLLDTYENISNLNRRLRVLSGARIRTRIDDTFSEHLSIVNACLAEDWDGAAKSMTDHLEKSRIVAFQLLAENE